MLVHLLTALRSSALFDDVIVTSGDDVLLSVATQCGVRTVRTDGAYRNGSHRVSAAVKKLELERDMIVNIQGDMPSVEPVALSGMLESLRASSVGCWTISRPCNSEQERQDPNRVKVVVDQASRALYFSRSPLPFNGSAEETRIHVGVYGFQAGQLNRYVLSPPSSLGSSEDLEQLDCLSSGHGLGVHHAAWSVPALDQPEDVSSIQSWFAKGKRQQNDTGGGY